MPLVMLGIHLNNIVPLTLKQRTETKINVTKVRVNVLLLRASSKMSYWGENISTRIILYPYYSKKKHHYIK